MSIASLINPYSGAFAFDHDQLHRTMLAAGPPGAITAILDPLVNVNVPAGQWNTDHAALHADFASAFPAITWPSVAEIADIDLEQGSAVEFWAFKNKNLHDLALTQLPQSG